MSLQPAPPPLRLTEVGVRVGDQNILSGVDLALYPGELLAVIGPSGAGKSTLIRVMLGLLAPSLGSARLGEGPPGAGGPVGYVPQDDVLHDGLRVEDALRFAAALRLPGWPPARQAAQVRAVISQVGLADRAGLRIRSLSGGQRKRVSVAMELLSAPPLLVLDEPTSGLDPGMEAQTMGLFSAVAARGHIVVVSTHATQSLGRADLLLVLMGGLVVFFGPPAEAAAWFGSPSLDGIFPRLAAERPESWAGRWRQSPGAAAVRDRPRPALGPRPAVGQVVDRPAPPGPAARPSPAEQLAALKASRGGERP
jgi:ABC-type multidrug transport system ATPase subunit